MLKSPIVMFVYAAFLIACGLAAFWMAPPDANPKTALIVSSATAAVMIVCGILAQMLHSRRTAGMIGIHAGLVFPLLFGVVLGIQSYSRFAAGEPDKMYLAWILAIMAAGSVIAFIAILLTRPPAAQRV